MGRFRLPVMAATVASLAGCTVDAATPSTDTGTDTDTDTVAAACQSRSPDGVSPWVSSGTIACGLLQDEIMTFWAQVSADDPQGSYTLAPYPNYVRANRVSDDSQVFEMAVLACHEDGECEGTWREQDQPDVTCADATSAFTFTAVVSDGNDNLSEPCLLTWAD